MFLFEFSEQTTRIFDTLVDELHYGGDYYADAVTEWRSQYRRQLSEQERQKRASMAQLPEWREECSQ